MPSLAEAFFVTPDMKPGSNAFVVYLCTFDKSMNHFFTLILCCLGLTFSTAQINGWKGYFSFYGVRDMAQGTSRMVAASENALFTNNGGTNVTKTTTTIDGLSGQSISSVHYSQAFNKTLIGYENGLMTVINEADGSILKVVDIINKQLPPNIKKVNHFSEHDGMVYISCDFGICQYNLQTLQFGDTYFIGPSVPEIIVSQTAVFDGYIYAATINNGIRRALITNPNLVDATQWAEVAGGSFAGIAAFADQVIAINSTGGLFRSNGGAFQSFGQTGTPMDFRAASDVLLVTTQNRVSIYNESLGVAAQINIASIPDIQSTFTCATSVGNRIYLGTSANGVFETTLSGGSFQDITPAGPLRNYIFSINTQSPDLWLTYGGYDYALSLNPYPLDFMGISKHNAEGWKHIPYEETHVPGKMSPDLVRMTFNPSNLNQFYVSSYEGGLLRFENEQLAAQLDHTNTQGGLATLVDPNAPGYEAVRIEQSAFDSSGNLWLSNGLLESPLRVLRSSGSWQSYDMTNVFANFFEERITKMVIDRADVKWFATEYSGVIGFHENGPVYQKITSGEETGNLPVPMVRALALDKNQALWIGTTLGLRVVNNTGAFQSGEQINANAIIILDEDNVAQELLYRTAITDIAVDGANNKWIGTADAGVYQVSPNGQTTLYHFTRDNSPLPSNTIMDIEINGATGEVFIATDKGMVSFGGIATDSAENLANVKVYPNPVRPGYSGTVKITNLIDNCNVKITDIAGNLVHETISEGGTIEWDTTAFGKYRVSSGVYMIFIATEDASETKVKKVMIVR